MRPVLLLVDDAGARDWAPFALTRPTGELLFGDRTLRARLEAGCGVSCVGTLSAPHLSDFQEDGAPPVITLAEAVRWQSEPRLLMLSRAVLRAPLDSLPDRSGTLRAEGRTVGWYVAPGDPLPEVEELLQPNAGPATVGAGPAVEVDGFLLDGPWSLVERNAAQLTLDLTTEKLSDGPLREAPAPGGTHRVGEHPLFLAPGARVDPGVILDTRAGPIALGRNVQVAGMTRLEGPVLAGPGTRIMGGSIASVSAGPECRLHGEISHSVILGFSNKAHDGYLGHALVGRWVNLGAFTTNSDLKNNYGPVRVTTPSGPQDTGLMKVGCFLGDHVKTGIGTLVNTGTVVGAGSNLFGGSMPPVSVPPFSWGSTEPFSEYRLEAFLEVARIVMGRRGVELDEQGKRYLRSIWTEGRAERPGR